MNNSTSKPTTAAKMQAVFHGQVIADSDANPRH